MRHVLRFKASGRTFAEVERAARLLALEYFDTPNFTLDVDAEALHRLNGTVVVVEADCEARLTGEA